VIGGMMRTMLRSGTVALTLAFANSSHGVAQMGSQQNLSIISIDGVRDAGPMAFEILVTLQNGSKASLRVNAAALKELTRQLNQIVIME
jgi:hypothetical protein